MTLTNLNGSVGLQSKIVKPKVLVLSDKFNLELLLQNQSSYLPELDISWIQKFNCYNTKKELTEHLNFEYLNKEKFRLIFIGNSVKTLDSKAKDLDSTALGLDLIRTLKYIYPGSTLIWVGDYLLPSQFRLDLYDCSPDYYNFKARIIEIIQTYIREL